MRILHRSVYITFILMMVVCTCSFSQIEKRNAQNPEFVVGLNVNPFLLFVYNTPELGPTITYVHPLNKGLEIGATFFTRQQYGTRKSEFGTTGNVKTTINLETVLTPHIAIVFGKRRVKNKVLAFAGLRNDYYKELLENETYSINEEYQYSEMNFLFGVGYQFQYKLKSGNGLSFRLLAPTNRNPLDDANRYSIELGYVFKLKR